MLGCQSRQSGHRFVLGCQSRQCGRGFVLVCQSSVWTCDCVSLSEDNDMQTWSGAGTNT